MTLSFRITLITGGLAALWLAALGCTSARHIEMKNETADTVHFVWTLNEDSLMANPFLLSNSKELRFTLVPAKTKAIKMSFGAGGWSPAEVQKLVGFLKSFEIVAPAEHIRLDSLPALRDFLLSRRKGIGGGRIEILVKNR